MVGKHILSLQQILWEKILRQNRKISEDLLHRLLQFHPVERDVECQYKKTLPVIVESEDEDRDFQDMPQTRTSQAQVFPPNY